MESSQASCEALWLHNLSVDLFVHHLRHTIIYCNNKICIHLSESPIFHDRSKYIEIGYHFIHAYVHKGEVDLQYISTGE